MYTQYLSYEIVYYKVVANLLMCGMCTWSVRTGVVCEVMF